ncbi:MAG: hypothetical protein KY464_14385 [Gemmatimonadetes bacterium]|nr:hypothetical protein [Gemmatimonadota bacterium]
MSGYAIEEVGVRVDLPWEERRRRTENVHGRTDVTGMNRLPRDPGERHFLRALGPERRYGGLVFVEVPDPTHPAVRQVSALLVDRFGSDEAGYLEWIHATLDELAGDCPHEALALGRGEEVLRLLEES